MTTHRQVVQVAEKRKAVQRLNDDTLEYLILGFRAVASISALALLASLVGLIWTWDYRWFLTACVAAVVGMLCGLLGFWQFGNEEWSFTRGNRGLRHE